MLFVVSLLLKLALASGNPIFMLLTVKAIRIAFTQSILAISTELSPQKLCCQDCYANSEGQEICGDGQFLHGLEDSSPQFVHEN